MFKIFVGNLAVTTDADSIRELFSRHADVDDIALPINEATGKSRGFAIVMIKDEQQARYAMRALRGTRLDGRTLVINQARKKGKVKQQAQRQTMFRMRPGFGRGASSTGRSNIRSFGTRPYRGLRGYGRPTRSPRDTDDQSAGDKGESKS